MSGLGTHLKNCHKEIKYDDYIKENFSIDHHVHEHEKIRCELCGKTYINLCQHLRWRHKDFNKEDYEKEFGKIILKKEYLDRSSGKAYIFSQKMKGLSPLERFQYILGQEKGLERYKSWRNNISKIYKLDWFVKKYGKEIGERKYQQRCDKIRKETNKRKIWLNRNLSPYSKISQILFQEIYKNISVKYKRIYFGELNHEFSCGTNRNFDFVIEDIKKVIEFNGDKFHVNPNLTEDQKRKWKQVYTNRTASEVETIDSNKIKNAKEKGYEFLIIWESDYKEDKDTVLKRCLEFIGE
ncbi:MAG: hypothetical protein M0P12_00985 [Paludibacteraceae bacterium]|nr:hypothetical protein [Paludibacteraceae bacterium]